MRFSRITGIASASVGHMQARTQGPDRRRKASQTTGVFSLLRPHLRVMPGDPPAAPTSAATPAYRQFFGARLKDQYGDHYYLIVSIFNGVVLAVAALALLAIFSSNVTGVVKANALDGLA